MADTTTPNLGLTLIGVGGDRDTWGDKLNANMTEIDAAVHAVAASVPSTAALMPKAGGDFSEPPTIEGGVVPRLAAGLTGGVITVSAASGADPTTAPGDIWLGY